jgi:ABC-type cobalamin/Fe3+-siderophores transport system ATPase subunit
MKLHAHGVSWSVTEAQIVREVSLHCLPGSFVGLIGPNYGGASGRSRRRNSDRSGA